MSLVFAIPLKEKSAQCTVHAYLTGIQAKVGGSCAILSYNGMEFHNKSLIAACDQLDTNENVLTPFTQKVIAM